MSARAGKGTGRATVGGELACEAELLFVLVDARRPDRRRTGAGIAVRIATWNVNSLTARLPAGRGVDRLRPTRRPLPAGDQAGRRRVPPRGLRLPRLRDRPSRRRAVERGGHRSAGSASTGVATGLGSADDDAGDPAHRRRLRWCAGRVGVRPQRSLASTASSTRPSSPGWPGSASAARGDHAHPIARSPCAATSTSPPRTATSGTRRSSRG